MGGSYAKALTDKGYEVYSITKEQKSVDFALAHGMIKAGTTAVDKEMIASADITVFALYPHVFVEWVKENGAYFTSSYNNVDFELVRDSEQKFRMLSNIERKADRYTEIAAAPAVLMTAYAVRGLDINSSYTIYNLLNKQKEKGVAVLFVGEDLDVLVALCDRILVLCDGQVNGVLDGRTATKEEIGYLMTNLKEDGGASNE